MKVDGFFDEFSDFLWLICRLKMLDFPGRKTNMDGHGESAILVTGLVIIYSWEKNSGFEWPMLVYLHDTWWLMAVRN